MTQKTRFTINIDEDILSILKTIAKEEYITPTTLARKVLSEYCISQRNKNHNISNAIIQQTKPVQSNKKHIKEFIL